MPYASTKRTTPSCGSTSTRARAPRCAASPPRVSFHVTVANYEYLVYWRFYKDGNIECEVRATGIMVTTTAGGQQPHPNGPRRPTDVRPLPPALPRGQTRPRRRRHREHGPRGRPADAHPWTRPTPAGCAGDSRGDPRAHRIRGQAGLRLRHPAGWKVVNPTSQRTRLTRRVQARPRWGRSLRCRSCNRRFCSRANVYRAHPVGHSEPFRRALAVQGNSSIQLDHGHSDWANGPRPGSLDREHRRRALVRLWSAPAECHTES